MSDFLPTTNSIQYTDIDDIIRTPEVELLSAQIDDNLKMTIANSAARTNMFAIPAYSDMLTDVPNLATNTYDPYADNNPFDLNTAEGRNLFVQNNLKNIDVSPRSAAPIIKNSIRSSNFERYFRHPEFDKLGWHPYRDNESVYNQNSTWWDDASRMFKQFKSLTATGFVSSYRSLGDIIRGDDYLLKDLDSAREFSDAMRIGNSTRTGVGKFINNTLLQSGYTFGILSSIALEEFSLAALTAMTGGATAPLFSAATARNIGRTTALGTELGRTANTLRYATQPGRTLQKEANAAEGVLETMTNVDNSRTFFDGIKTGENRLLNILAPEYAAGLKQLNTAKNTGQNITNLAKLQTHFGGFYRTLRGYNFAVSEGKMEAGLVYDNVLGRGIAEREKELGRGLTANEINDVKKQANRAAFTTTMFNAPVIFLSNQLVLGNAFGTFDRSLARFFNDNSSKVLQRIRSNRPKVIDGKLSGDAVVDIGRGLTGAFNTLKRATPGTTFQGTAAGALRYFSANFAEGTQEVYQEAVSHGVQHYFDAIIKDPSAGGIELMRASALSGMNAQYTAQGFETFMSGFVMGGLVQGPQKLMFQGIPNAFQATFRSEQFKETRDQEDKLVESVVKTINEAANKMVIGENPLDFSPHTLNYIVQKQVSEELGAAVNQESVLGFIDNKDMSRFINTIQLIKTGGIDIYADYLTDLNKLTDAELLQAFQATKEEADAGKIRERIAFNIQEVDKIKELYKTQYEQIVNKFNPSLYERGTTEYNQEIINYLGVEHAKFLAVFTGDGLRRAVERKVSLLNELEATQMFEGMRANDLSVLRSEDSMLNEIAILESEIKTLEGQLENIESTQLLADRQRLKEDQVKLRNLEKIYNIVKDQRERGKSKKDKSYNWRGYKAMRPAIDRYVKELSEVRGVTVDPSILKNDVYQKIMDYYSLDARTKLYDKTLEFLLKPEGVTRVTEAFIEYAKYISQNAEELVKDQVTDYLDVQKKNELLNQLDDIGIIPDDEELKEFNKTGDASKLQKFYDNDGVLVEDKEQIQKINKLKNTYTKLKNVKKKKKKSDDIVFKYDKKSETFSTKYFQDLVDKVKPKGQTRQAFLSTERGKALKQTYLDVKARLYELVADSAKKDATFKRDSIMYTLINKYLQYVTPIVDKSPFTIDNFLEPTREKTRAIDEAKLKNKDGKSGKINGSKIGFHVREVSGKHLLYNGKRTITKAEKNKFGVKSIYDNEIEANLALETIKDLQKQEKQEFKVGKKKYKYGSTVKDTNGVKYKVIGVDPETKELITVPANEYSSKIKKDSYKNGKRLSGKNVKKEKEKPAKTVKSNLYEFANLYKNDELDEETFREIISELTPEIRSRLILSIVRNENGGQFAGKYLRSKDGKIVNKRIGKFKEPFTVGLTLAQQDIEYLSQKTGLLIPANGTFAFINTGNTKILAEEGDYNEVINVLDLTDNEIKELFKNASERDIPLLKKQYVTQQLLVDSIEKLLTDSNIGLEDTSTEIEVMLSDVFPTVAGQEQELPFEVIIPKTNAKTVSEEVGLDELSKNSYTYNGVEYKVVLTSQYDEAGLFKSYFMIIYDENNRNVSDQEIDGEQLAILIEDDIRTKLGLENFDTIAERGGLVYFVNLPNGSTIYNKLTPKTMPIEQLNGEIIRILEAQLDTLENNTRRQGRGRVRTAIDDDYVSDVNKQTKDKIFISYLPGFDFELIVTPNGYINFIVHQKIEKDGEYVYQEVVRFEHTKLVKQGDIQEFLTKHQDDTSSIKLINNFISAFNSFISSDEGFRMMTSNINENKLQKGAKTKLTKESLKLSVKNFKYSYDKLTNIEDFGDVEKLTASTLNPDVFLSQILNIYLDASVTQKFIDTYANLAAQNKPTKRKKKKKKKLEENEELRIKSQLDYIDKNILQEKEDGDIQALKLLAYAQAFAGFEGLGEDTFEDLEGVFEDNKELIANYSVLYKLLVDAYTQLRKGADAYDIQNLSVDGANIIPTFNMSYKFKYDSKNPNKVVELRVTWKKGPGVNTDATLEDFISDEYTVNDLFSIRDKIDNQILNPEKVDVNENFYEDEVNNLYKDYKKDGVIKAPAKYLGDQKFLDAVKNYSEKTFDSLDTLTGEQEEKQNEFLDYLDSLSEVLENNIENKGDRLDSIVASVTPLTSDTSVSDLIAYLQEVLPPGLISVEKLSDFYQGVADEYTRVGQFLSDMRYLGGKLVAGGVILTDDNLPNKFHEVFHGVFRLLLTDEQQAQVLSIARKEVRAKLRRDGIKFEDALDAFREMKEDYQKLSQDELIKLYYEEYVADQFQLFKKNPKSRQINAEYKSIFQKIIDFIKSLFDKIFKTSGYDGLNTLFEDIDSGRFRNSQYVYNTHNNSTIQGLTLSADSIIPFQKISLGGDKIDLQYLDPATSDNIISQILGNVILQMQQVTDQSESFTSMIKNSVAEVRSLYDKDRAIYKDKRRDRAFRKKLSDASKAFENFEKEIIEIVESRLNMMDFSKEQYDDQLEEVANTFGMRNVDHFDITAEHRSGFKSAPKFVRTYFSTTLVPFDKDYFGNEYFQDTVDSEGRVIAGERIMVPLDVKKAFDAALKAVQNTTDPAQIVTKLLLYSITNQQLNAFVRRFFNDVGLSYADTVSQMYDDNGIIRADLFKIDLEKVPQNKRVLFNVVIKSLVNFSVPYLFEHTVTTGKKKTNRVYFASNRDEANTIINNWADAHMLKAERLSAEPQFKNQAENFLKRFFYKLNNKGTELGSDQKLIEDSMKLAEGFRNYFGISYAPMYLQYALIVSRSKKVKLTEYQNNLLNSFPKSIRDLAIDATDVEEISKVIQSYGKVRKSGKDSKYLFNDKFGAKTRIFFSALGNAQFDETVGASTHLNADGKTVYNHQMATYDLVSAKELNNPNVNQVKQKLKEDKPDTNAIFFDNNYLLNLPAFQRMMRNNRVQIVRLSGSKFSFERGGKQDYEFTGKEDGLAFSKMRVNEYIKSLLNLYTTAVHNNDKARFKDSMVYKEDNKIVDVYLPVAIRILEASNTPDLAMLPIIKAVELNKTTGTVDVTDEVLTAFMNEVINEISRIQSESNPDAGFATDELIVGYNAIETDVNDQTMTTEIVPIELDNIPESEKQGRAYKLWKTRKLIDPDILDEFGETVRMSPGPLQAAIKDGLVDRVLFNKGSIKNHQIRDKVKVSNIIDPEGDFVTRKTKFVGTVKLNSKTNYQLFKTYLDLFREALYEKKKSLEGKVYEIQDGKKKYYTNIKSVADFLNGKVEKDVYEVVEDEVVEGEEAVADKFDDLKTKLETEARKILPMIKTESGEEVQQRPIKNEEDFAAFLANLDITIDEFKQYLQSRLNAKFSDFETVLSNNDILQMDDLNQIILKGSQASAINRGLNLRKDNVEYNLKQIYLNDYLLTTSYMDIYLGDEALSFENAVNQIKRAKGLNGAIVNSETEYGNTDLGIDRPVKKFDLLTMTDRYARSTLSGDLLEATDAQLYMTVKAFKHFWFGVARLTKRQKNLLDKIENGIKIKPQEVFDALDDTGRYTKGYVGNSEMINAKKLLYFDGAVFLKMSALMLSKELTSVKEGGKFVASPVRENLHALRERMETHERNNDGALGIATYMSASKMMKKRVQSINEMMGENGEFDVNNPESKYYTDPAAFSEIRAKFLGLQVVNPSNKEGTIDPTQMKVIITSQMDSDEAQATDVMIGDQMYNLGQIREMYFKTKSAKIKQTHQNKRNLNFSADLGSDVVLDELIKSTKANQITPVLYNFLKYAIASLQSSGTAANLVEYFKINDFTGASQYNLNSRGTALKFMQLYLSYFSKKVMSESLPGTKGTIVSDEGLNVYRFVYTVDENGLPDKHDIIKSNDFFELGYTRQDIALSISVAEYQYDDNGNVVKTIFQKRPGDDRNLTGNDGTSVTLKSLVEASEGKGVIIVDRLRPNLKEYKKEGPGIDKNNPDTWVDMQKKYSETLMPSLSGDVYHMFEQVQTSQNIKDHYYSWRNTREAAESLIKSKTKNEKLFFTDEYGQVVSINKSELADVEVQLRKIFAKKYGYTYLERDKIFVSDEISRDIPNAVSDQFNTRIPSQDFHSSNYAKVVDFLPIFYGTTLATAREMTVEVSGADFDIDSFFMHLKEYYIDNGEVVEYTPTLFDKKTGEPINARQGYNMYINYVNTHVNKQGSVYKEANQKYNAKNPDGKRIFKVPEKARFAGKVYLNALSTKMKNQLLDEGFSESSLRALQTLGMPKTYQEYVDYIKYHKAEPYEGALDNASLDQKIALIANKYLNTPNQNGNVIHWEPADIQALTELFEKILKEEVPEWYATKRERDLDVNGLDGKAIFYENNKEGSWNIGAIVRPNVVLNLLGQFKIKLNPALDLTLEFNNNEFNTFGQEYEIKNDGSVPYRTQYLISNLITAMTDNAKGTMAYKLGLTKKALVNVATMLSLGVPLKTAILMVNNPIISKALRQKNYVKILNDALESIINAVDSARDVSIEDPVNVNDNDIKKTMQTSGIVNFFNLNPSDLKEEALNKENRDAFIAQKAIIKQFLKVDKISKYVSNVGQLTTLTKEYGANLQSLLEKEEAVGKLFLDVSDYDFDQEYNKSDSKIVFDVRPIFTASDKESKSIYGAYYDVYRENYDVLMPSVFLQRTEGFNSIYKALIANMKSFMPSEVKSNVSYDLVSYLTILAYQNYLRKNQPTMLDTLNNDLLYSDPESPRNIVNKIKQLRRFKKDGDFVFANNYFLNNFLITNDRNNEENKSGISKIEINTFAKIDPRKRDQLEASLLQLINYPNKLVRENAKAIIHYSMVKDGLSLKYGGLINIFSPKAYVEYLNSVDLVMSVFSKDQIQRSDIQDLFGEEFESIDDVFKKFNEGYLKSTVNIYKKILPSFKNLRQTTDLDTETLNVSIVSKDRDGKNDKLASLAQKNKGITYIDFNESKENTKAGKSNIFILNYKLKEGLGIKATQYQELLEKMKFSISKLKKKLGIDQDVRIKNSGKPVAINTRSINFIYTNVLAQRKVQDNISIYDLVDELLFEEFGVELDFLRDYDTAAEDMSAYISLRNNKKVLVINPYRYDKDKIDGIQNDRIPGKSKNKQALKNARESINLLTRFTAGGITISEEGTFKKDFPQMLLPEYLYNYNQKRKEGTLFKMSLIKYADEALATRTVDNPKVQAFYAEYEEVDMEGSSLQINGFQFDGQLPTKIEIDKFVDSRGEDVDVRPGELDSQNDSERTRTSLTDQIQNAEGVTRGGQKAIPDFKMNPSQDVSVNVRADKKAIPLDKMGPIKGESGSNANKKQAKRKGLLMDIFRKYDKKYLKDTIGSTFKVSFKTKEELADKLLEQSGIKSKADFNNFLERIKKCIL